MEQHVDQHAVLNSMGNAPMASSVSAVVALPVDPAAPATAPLDDVTIGTGGSASDTATSIDNNASTQLLVTSDGSQASTQNADFSDFDATDSSPESSTVIPTDDGSSGALSEDIPPGGVNTPAVQVPTPAPNVIHCGTPGCRQFPGSDPSGPLLLESQTIMAEHLSLLEQHSDQQAILTSLGDAPTSCGSDAIVVPVVGPSVGAVGQSVAPCGVRLFVVLLDPSADLLLASAVGGPSGSTLRVVEDVDGSGTRAGVYLAAVNNARRFSSPRQAETIINNSRALELHVRLVPRRAPSADQHKSQLPSGADAPPPPEPLNEPPPPPPVLPPEPDDGGFIAGDDAVFIDDGTEEDEDGNTFDPSVPAPPAGGSIGDVAPVDNGASDIPEQMPPDSSISSCPWPSSKPEHDCTPTPTPAPAPAPMHPPFGVPFRAPTSALLLEQIRSSPVFLLSLESPRLSEICAGCGTLSDDHNAEGIARLLSETDACDQSDFFSGQWQCPASVLAISTDALPWKLWLVDGRVVSPSTSEPWHIQEYNTDGFNDFIVCNRGHLSDVQQLKLLHSMPGKGLPARLANAMEARTADRVRLLQAVVDGRIAPFSSSLESGLAASCIPFRPIEGSALIFTAIVTWVDGVPRILASFKDAALPAFVANGAEARAPSLSHVDSIFSAASPSTPVPVGFLVDDFIWCRVIDVPLASWCTLSDLGGTPLRLIAFRALAAVAYMLQSSLRDAMPAPALTRGAVAPRFVPQPPPTFAVDPVRWTRQIAECAAATSALRNHEWAILVKDLDEASVPPNLRAADVNYGDPQYAHTPLTYRDSIQITVPASVPPEQQSSYRTRNITPDIFTVEVAKRWALRGSKVLYDLVRYRIYPDAASPSNEPFVVTQEELHPDARDIFWDLRFRRSDESFAPLDFTRRVNTPPAAASVTSNATARPQFDPHGNGVRIGESGVPAPSAGMSTAPVAPTHLLDPLLAESGVPAPSAGTSTAPVAPTHLLDPLLARLAVRLVRAADVSDEEHLALHTRYRGWRDEAMAAPLRAIVEAADEADRRHDAIFGGSARGDPPETSGPLDLALAHLLERLVETASDVSDEERLNLRILLPLLRVHCRAWRYMPTPSPVPTGPPVGDDDEADAQLEFASGDSARAHYPSPAPIPTPPPPAAMPPPAADVVHNVTARTRSDPHGNGVRVGEAHVPAPNAGTGDADTPAPPVTDRGSRPALMRSRSPPAPLEPTRNRRLWRAKNHRVLCELIAYEEGLMMDVWAEDTFHVERNFSLHAAPIGSLADPAPSAPPLRRYGTTRHGATALSMVDRHGNDVPQDETTAAAAASAVPLSGAAVASPSLATIAELRRRADEARTIKRDSERACGRCSDQMTAREGGNRPPCDTTCVAAHRAAWQAQCELSASLARAQAFATEPTPAPTPAPAPPSPPPPAMPPAAADAAVNETARPHSNPHGNGVRIGEARVPAPSAGTGDAVAPSLNALLLARRPARPLDPVLVQLLARLVGHVFGNVTPDEAC
jgi:hypothetical protein